MDGNLVKFLLNYPVDSSTQYTITVNEDKNSHQVDKNVISDILFQLNLQQPPTEDFKGKYHSSHVSVKNELMYIFNRILYIMPC